MTTHSSILGLRIPMDRLFITSVLSPTVSYSQPLPLRKLSNTSWQVQLRFLGGSRTSENLCRSSRNGVSFFPSALQMSCIQDPLALKANALGVLLSYARPLGCLGGLFLHENIPVQHTCVCVCEGHFLYRYLPPLSSVYASHEPLYKGFDWCCGDQNLVIW